LLTPADVRRLLERHGLAPSKARGQNFVVDPNTVRKVVRDAGVRAGELVCEVGPGLGSLTLALREAGARVVAVEVDAGLVHALRDVLGDDPGVRIVHADALAVDLSRLLGGGPAALVANLPYNLATPLILAAMRVPAFSRAHVMVQREVGQRWVARPGDALYGAVSVKLAALAESRLVAAVPRGAFWPVPNVDSVTVALCRRTGLAADRDSLFRLIDEGFAQRRKRLRNALAVGGRTAATVESALRAAGLDPFARAEELALDDWMRLAGVLTAPPRSPPATGPP
jgi:16S rRNA (adenine1518-N6/adenine1519-N6)-dimethyltransferase